MDGGGNRGDVSGKVVVQKIDSRVDGGDVKMAC